MKPYNEAMLENPENASQSTVHESGAAALSPTVAHPQTDEESFFVVEGKTAPDLILLCDHARNRIPAEYHQLGLPDSELERHIAFDIGVETVTRELARQLDVPAVFSNFSRLLIDPNRGRDDPTLVMRLSDGAVVPGNANHDEVERNRRIEQFYQPYHDAVSAKIDQAISQGVNPVLLSVHSFTPFWKGVPRKWHGGILRQRGIDNFPDYLLQALSREPGLVIGDDEPYRGGLPGDTLDFHGTRRGLGHALLEIRQDLIADEAGCLEWADRLSGILAEILTMPDLHG